MIKQFLIISLLFIAAICEINVKDSTEAEKTVLPEKRFETNVYGFNIPLDWNITDKEEIDQGIYYVSVEKNGLDSSGLATIVSFEFLVNLDELIKANFEELKSNQILNNLSFGTIEDSKFNGITARHSRFSFRIMGMNHQGSVYAFNNKNNTVVTLFQEALEDKAENNNGFKTIESSFEMK